MNNNTRHLMSRALPAVLLALCAATAGAQIGTPPPEDVVTDAANTSARVLTFRTGMAITPASGYYDNIANTLRIQGEFDSVPFYMDTTNLKVVINGEDILQVPGAVFGVDPPLGITTTAAFTVDFPLPTDLPEFPTIDIRVELVFIPHNQTIARETVSLYDFRFPQGATLADAPESPAVGIDYQLTDYGLGGAGEGVPTGIEEIVFAEYPPPSLEAFNEQLSTIAQGLAERESTDLKACIDLADLGPDEFRSPAAFPPLRNALNQARASYFSFLACEASAPPLVDCNRICVTEVPTASDFELCVDTIRGRPVGASVETFEDLELAFVDGQAPGLIEATLEFTGYQAQVDLLLRDLIVRYKRRRCVGRPLVRIGNAQIPPVDWLNDWATCPATQVDATRALTDDLLGAAPRYAIDKDAVDPARLEISDERATRFGFEEVSRDAAIGTCGEEFIFEDADATLNLFVSDGLSPLDEAVNDGFPQTALSQLLDEAFEEMAIDLAEPDEYVVNARIGDVATSTVHGLMLDWETLVQPKDVEDIGRLRPEYLVQGVFPPYLARDSLDHLGNTISSKFGMHTFWVNQVLWARSATEVINQVMAFTEAELGISTDTEREVTQFDGVYLANIFPAFFALSGQTVELRLERQLDPFLFQPDDPQETLPDVGHPLRYGGAGVRLYIKAPDTTDAGGNLQRGETFVSLDLNFYEPTFSLESGSGAGEQFLSPLLPELRWQVNVLDMDIRDCQKYTHEFPSLRANSCEGQMEVALRQFLEERLHRVSERLVDQIPAPQYFALDGDSALELQTDNVSRLHQFGSIDVFDLLLRP